MTKQMKLALGVAAGVVLLFCSSFVFFFTRMEKSAASAFLTNSKVGKPLPRADLVDLRGNPLADDNLRTGRVMLVFVSLECNACQKETQFLKTVVGKRDDIRYYGIASLGSKKPDEEAEKDFPFKLYYDKGMRLATSLGINKIPVKVFVEDGFIKKAWGGASSEEDTRLAFVQWLSDLK
jgi:hypothetical protein